MGALHVRQFGIRTGVDYVVWGSLTIIGQRYSLDAKMLSSFGKQPPQVFFKEGQRLETLERTVQELTRDVGLKLFRRQKVTTVTVEGNRRIEADAILRVIQTEPGAVFQAKELSEDLKRVYKMGFFDDVRIEAEDGTEGKSVVFKVKEKPTIRKITFEGNDVYDDDEILKNVTLNTGSILNIFRIKENIKRIEDLYKEKNYHTVQVTYRVESLENNQADLEFVVAEGKKLLIRSIDFKGNSRFTDEELKKLMKISEKGFFSWITSSGELNREDLEQDMGRIQAFYHNKGYIEAKVDQPEVAFEEDRISIAVKLKSKRGRSTPSARSIWPAI
jgi:outer membrane protein insertion porin family